MICIRRKSVATRVYKYRSRSRNDLYRIAPQAVSRPNNFPDIYEDAYVGSLGYEGTVGPFPGATAAGWLVIIAGRV